MHRGQEHSAGRPTAEKCIEAVKLTVGMRPPGRLISRAGKVKPPDHTGGNYDAFIH